MDFTEKTIATEPIFEGKVIRVRRDTVVLPNGREAKRELIAHPGGVGIIAVNQKREVLMVEQYRIAFRTVLLEVPAGKLEVGEDPLECGVRELSEETGYEAGKVQFLGEYYPTPGYCEEKITLYLATQLQPGKQHLDQDEFLSVKTIPLDTLYEMVMNNQIHDAKTVIAVLKAKAILG